MNKEVGFYAVMGHPVEHSVSPLLHRLFAQQASISLVYEKILVPLNGFPQALAEFRQRGGKGLNVTLPFKQQAYHLSERLTERAQQARAVNTLCWGAATGELHGDNTDGAGLIRDIQINHDYDLAGKTVLLLGASGAARGILGPLLDCMPACVSVVNRTFSKACTLAECYSGPSKVVAASYEEVGSIVVDCVINATSASLNNEIPPLPSSCIASHTVCYDLVYTQGMTVFSQWAQQQGAKSTWDGWGMLVEQAAESFHFWHRVYPETNGVLEQLKAQCR